MKLQFWHNNDYHCIHNSYTVAVIQPYRVELEALERKIEIGEPAVLTLTVGIARMHPKEKEFVKKLGREIAKKNFKTMKFNLTNLSKTSGVIYYDLFTDAEDYHITFMLSHGKNTAFMRNLSKSRSSY